MTVLWSDSSPAFRLEVPGASAVTFDTTSGSLYFRPEMTPSCRVALAENLRRLADEIEDCGFAQSRDDDTKTVTQWWKAKRQNDEFITQKVLVVGAFVAVSLGSGIAPGDLWEDARKRAENHGWVWSKGGR